MRNFAMVVSVVALLAASLLAQHRMGVSGGHGPAGASHGSSGTRHSGFAPGTRRNSFGVSGRPFGFRHRGYGRYGYYWPHVYPDYYPDYYESDYEAPPPPAPEQTAPAPQMKQEPVPEPALLELQGGQFVKVNSFTIAANQPAQVSPAASAKQMPPTVLVYRDGHTEELTSYSIIGNEIYTKSDYWTNGAWTRKIQIADLDIPATLKQNQQRGVNFELPSGPDEVMIRQ